MKMRSKMNHIKRNFSLKIYLTIQETAESFCDMDEEEMAEFFNLISDITGKWPNPFCMQLQYVTDSKRLNQKGRNIMEQIGEYSQPTKD